jgi:hypothetical protein
MKTKFLKFFWGGILISLVGLTVACIAGYVTFDYLIGSKSLLIFTSLSIAFFTSYFVSGVRNWAWLFPSLLTAALGLNAAGVFEKYGTPIIAFPILLSIAIPFYVGFFLDRKQWGWLIPAWFLTIIAIIPPLNDQLNPDVLTALVLYAISLPFLVGYLVDLRCKWAIFISAVFGFIGVFSLIETIIHGDILGPVAMLIISLPFFIMFLASKRRRWALIPSGIFISIGVVALLDRLLPVYDYILVGNHQVGIYTSLLFLGFAATFGVLWRLNTSQHSRWAVYPAIGFLAASFLAIVLGENFQSFLPEIALLIAGSVLISVTFPNERVTHQTSS